MCKSNKIITVFILCALVAGCGKSKATDNSESSARTKVVKPSNVIKNGPWPPIADATVIPAENTVSKNYYVLLDTSGSMKNIVDGKAKIHAAKDAMFKFIEKVPEDVNLGLMFFGPHPEKVALGINNRDAFAKMVEGAFPKGGTPLIQSIQLGYHALTKQAQRQGGYGEYQLIIVTDGASSDGDPAPLSVEIVNESPIEIQVIGFGVKDHALNIPGVTNYVKADSPEELVKALTAVTQAETENFADSTEFDANP